MRLNVSLSINSYHWHRTLNIGNPVARISLSCSQFNLCRGESCHSECQNVSSFGWRSSKGRWPMLFLAAQLSALRDKSLPWISTQFKQLFMLGKKLVRLLILLEVHSPVLRIISQPQGSRLISQPQGYNPILEAQISTSKFKSMLQCSNHNCARDSGSLKPLPHLSLHELS